MGRWRFKIFALRTLRCDGKSLVEDWLVEKAAMAAALMRGSNNIRNELEGDQ